jgi:hypothetical protein
MIEQHYGHVNTIKHADRVLQGMAGWEMLQPDDTKAKALLGGGKPYFAGPVPPLRLMKRQAIGSERTRSD